MLVHYDTRSRRYWIQWARAVRYIFKNGKDISIHRKGIDEGQRFHKRPDLIGFQASLEGSAKKYDAFQETSSWSQEQMSIFVSEF